MLNNDAMRSWLQSLLLAGTLVLVLVVLGVVPVNLSVLRDTIRQISYETLGVEISIEGGLLVRLGLTPQISGGDISIGLPATDGEPKLLRIRKLAITPRVRDMINGKLHFSSIDIAGVDLDFCAPLPDFEANDSPQGPMPSLAFDEITLDTLRAACKESVDGGALSVTVKELNAELPATGSSRLSAAGLVTGLPAELPARLQASTDNINAILAGPVAIPIQLSGELASVLVNFDGMLRNIDTEPTISAALELSSADERWLASLARTNMPALGTLAAGFRLEASAIAIDITELQAEVGNVPGLEQPLAIRNTTLSLDIDTGLLELSRSSLDIVDNTIDLTAQLDTGADCPALEVTAEVAPLDIAPIWQLARRASDDLPSLEGRADAVDLNLRSCGTALAEHLRSLDMRSELRGAGNISVAGSLLPLSIGSLRLQSGWNEPTLLEFDGRLINEPANALITAGTAQALITGQTATLDARLVGAGADISLSGHTGLGSALDGYTAQLTELLDFEGSGKEPFLEGTLSVTAPRMGRLHNWVAVTPDSELPLNATAKILLTTDNIITEKFAAQLGDSDLSGRVTVDLLEESPVIAVTAESSRLDVQQIDSLLPAAAPGREQSGQQPAEPGRLRQINLESQLLKDIELPSISVDVRLNEVTGTLLQIDDIVVSGQLTRRQVQDAKLELLIEEIPFRGSVDADLRAASNRIDAKFGASDVDLDRILAALGIFDGQDIDVASVEAYYSTTGASLRELIRYSRLDTEIRTLRWTDKQSTDESSFIVDLDLVRLSLEPENPFILQTEGYVNGVSLGAWASTPSFYDIVGDEARIPFRLIAGSRDYTLMLDGVADRGNEEFFAGNLMLSGTPTSIALEDAPNMNSPLDGFALNLDLRAYDNGDFAADLNARKGSSELTGFARLSSLADRRKLDIDLTAPRIQTYDFVGVADQWRKAQAYEADGSIGAGEAGLDEAATPELAKDEGNMVLIFDDFITALVAESDVELNVSVADLAAGDYKLGTGELRLRLDEDGMAIDPLSIRYDEGSVDVTYGVASDADQRNVKLDVLVDNLQVGGLLPLLNPDIDVDAMLYLDADLGAETVVGELGIDTIQGEIMLLAIPQDLDAGVLDLWATNLVLALLPTPDTGDKVMNCMVASFEVEEGVLSTKNILLDSTDIIVRGRGDISVPLQELDLLVAPQAKRERFFSVSTPVRVTGPWDDYQIGVEPGGFIGTLFRWYMSLVYVPFKWLTGERFPADGLETCFNELGQELPPEFAVKQSQ